MAIYPKLGDWGSIAVSGAVFALAHVYTGMATPENQFAGFFLAWAYLKSKSILVPIAMHSGGNLIAMVVQISCWEMTVQRTVLFVN